MILRRVVALTALLPAVAAWRLHPIHAARVEVDVTASGSVSATVRVYRDDLPPGAGIAEVATCLDRGLVLDDAHGARVTLRVVAVVPEGDRTRISLAGSAPGGISRGRIVVPLLQERFADQVNVVEIRTPGGHSQLVFLRGDRPQTLP